MPKIESTKRDIPSSFQTIDEEPVKKAPKKEMAGSFSTGNTAGTLTSSFFKYCRRIFERNVTVSNQHPTISFNKEKVPVSDEQHTLKTNSSEQTIFSTTESSSETESNATSSESSSETESNATSSESSSETEPNATSSESSSETESNAPSSETSSETESSAETSESSSETESSAETSESSSETESSAETSESSSKADSTSSISYIQVNRLSLAQLLDRFNFLLSKQQDLLPFQIMGIPSSNEFKQGYVKLLLQIHPDKAGSKHEELFKSIFPICQELLARL